jgi:hypothetical protein
LLLMQNGFWAEMVNQAWAAFFIDLTQADLA